MPFFMGMRYTSSFAHFHDFEPCAKNHMVPGYGIFGRLYTSKYHYSSASGADAYSGMKKTHGPPHTYFSAIYDPLESNEYLNKKGIPAEEARHPDAQKRFLESTPSPATV